MVRIPFWRQRTKPVEAPVPISPERAVRELLRENLAALEIDLFYSDDPLIKMDPKERTLYLKKFFDLFKDTFLMERIKFHINQQARKTIENSGKGIQDVAGAMNINGMAFIKDDIEKLANLYIKETTQPKEAFDRFQIIPKSGSI